MSSPSVAKRVARSLIWPLRRFFDPRFTATQSQVVESENRIHVRLDDVVTRPWTLEQTEQLRAYGDSAVSTITSSITSSMAQFGVALDEMVVVLQGELDRNALSMRESAEHLAAISKGELFRWAVGAPVEKISEHMAQLLNYSESHAGFRAQRGLWFNPPVGVEYAEGSIRPSTVNERVVEIPYVLRALGGLAAGAKILDVGSSESTLSLSLASLGYSVTALDLRLYPLSHPRLRSVAAPLEQWDGAGQPFDAVICLSSIEHFGLGAYGESEVSEDADRAALMKLRQLVRPDGMLILTAPFGIAALEESQRVYDREGLMRLVEGWTVTDLSIAAQEDDLTWIAAAPDVEPQAGRRYTVMLTATAGEGAPA